MVRINRNIFLHKYSHPYINPPHSTDEKKNHQEKQKICKILTETKKNIYKFLSSTHGMTGLAEKKSFFFQNFLF